MEAKCHFAQKCAYKHQRNLNSPITMMWFKKIFKKFKVEVGSLKGIIKTLVKNREEEEGLKKSIKDIIEQIKILSASNQYIKKNDLLENESDQESESAVVKEPDVVEMEKNVVVWNVVSVILLLILMLLNKQNSVRVAQVVNSKEAYVTLMLPPACT